MNSFTFNDQEYVMVIHGNEEELGEDHEVILTLHLGDGKIIGTRVDEKDLFKFSFSKQPNRSDTFYAVTKEYYDNLNLNFAKSLLKAIDGEPAPQPLTEASLASVTEKFSDFIDELVKTIGDDLWEKINVEGEEEEE